MESRLADRSQSPGRDRLPVGVERQVSKRRDAHRRERRIHPRPIRRRAARQRTSVEDSAGGRVPAGRRRDRSPVQPAARRGASELCPAPAPAEHPRPAIALSLHPRRGRTGGLPVPGVVGDRPAGDVLLHPLGGARRPVRAGDRLPRPVWRTGTQPAFLVGASVGGDRHRPSFASRLHRRVR